MATGRQWNPHGSIGSMGCPTARGQAGAGGHTSRHGSRWTDQKDVPVVEMGQAQKGRTTPCRATTNCTLPRVRAQALCLLRRQRHRGAHPLTSRLGTQHPTARQQWPIHGCRLGRHARNHPCWLRWAPRTCVVAKARLRGLFHPKGETSALAASPSPLRFERETQCLARDLGALSSRLDAAGTPWLPMPDRNRRVGKKPGRGVLPLPPRAPNAPGSALGRHQRDSGLLSAGLAPRIHAVCVCVCVCVCVRARAPLCVPPSPDPELTGCCPGGALRWMDGWKWKGPDKTTRYGLPLWPNWKSGRPTSENVPRTQGRGLCSPPYTGSLYSTCEAAVAVSECPPVLPRGRDTGVGTWASPFLSPTDHGGRASSQPRLRAASRRANHPSPPTAIIARSAAGGAPPPLTRPW